METLKKETPVERSKRIIAEQEAIIAAEEAKVTEEKLEDEFFREQQNAIIECKNLVAKLKKEYYDYGKKVGGFFDKLVAVNPLVTLNQVTKAIDRTPTVFYTDLNGETIRKNLDEDKVVDTYVEYQIKYRTWNINVARKHNSTASAWKMFPHEHYTGVPYGDRGYTNPKSVIKKIDETIQATHEKEAELAFANEKATEFRRQLMRRYPEAEIKIYKGKRQGEYNWPHIRVNFDNSSTMELRIHIEYDWTNTAEAKLEVRDVRYRTLEEMESNDDWKGIGDLIK